MSQQLKTIDFHGTTLVAIPGNAPETTLVAMKPIVEGMGLDWEAQRKKLERHPVLNICTSIMEVQITGDDQTREHTFLSLEMMNFWLATIHPDRIKDQDVRSKIIQYQTECARVLFNHFFGKAIASGNNLNAQQVGGIAKGVILKALSPVIEQMNAMQKEMRGLISSHDNRVAAIEAKTAKEWLEEYKCIQTGRRRMVTRVSAALRLLALQHGVSLSKCARTGTWLYPISVARPYMETIGKSLIRKHNDQITLGQSSLSLPKSRRKKQDNTRPFSPVKEKAS